MPRKITASFFLMTMSFLIVFQLSVFAYCLCESEFISAPCSCEQCKSLNADESQDGKQSSPRISSVSHDCNQLLDLNVDQFLAQTQNFDTSSPDILAIISDLGYSTHPARKTSKAKLTPIRGSPLLASNLPLYLKHSVFRL